MNEFLQRLRERKLVQWAVAYVAAAFALLQALDIVAQQFGWPDGLRRGITIALVIGFFVTLVLAWYHGERGAKDSAIAALRHLLAISYAFPVTPALLRIDPDWDNLRDDPRFQKLIADGEAAMKAPVVQ